MDRNDLMKLISDSNNTSNITFKDGIIYTDVINPDQQVITRFGGQDGDTIEEIRQNSISQFATQMRNVTADDYLVRTLSMPSKFGTICIDIT